MSILLLALLLVVSGCQSVPGSEEAQQSATESDTAGRLFRRTQRLLGTGQNNTVVQADRQKSEAALERAEEQTCPEAEPFQEATREAAASLESLAQESGEILSSVQAAMDQAGTASRIEGQANDRINRNRGAFNVAQGDLYGVRNLDARSNQTRPVGQVWEIAETQFNAVRDRSRDALTAAEDLQMAMATEEGQALLAWTEPDEDVDGLIRSAIAQANVANDEWIRLASVEVQIPEDRSTRIDQMGGAEVDDLEDHLDALVDVGDAASEACAAVGQVTLLLNQVQARISHYMNDQSERTAAIAQETGPLAAEATRNAWRAVEACGGEVPEEHQSWLENPFDDYTTIPQWNSTFWDISSP